MVDGSLGAALEAGGAPDLRAGSDLGEQAGAAGPVEDLGDEIGRAASVLPSRLRGAPAGRGSLLPCSVLAGTAPP